MSEKTSDLVWQKYLSYLKELAPRIYITKTVRVLTQEALKASQNDPRLKAIDEFLAIVSRPEKESNSSKFTF